MITCDKCDRPASVHETVIQNGNKIEHHLCEQCATQDGVTIKPHTPIYELLARFVEEQSRRREELDKNEDPP